MRKFNINQDIKWVVNQKSDGASYGLDNFNTSVSTKAKKFHQSLPEYQPTPLLSLDALAEKLKVGRILVKDESFRFGLNSFKGLGCSYAMARYLAGLHCEEAREEVTYPQLVSPEWRAKTGKLTFVTATDGNHGKGVAWIARRLGHHAVVYMPKGSSLQRLKSIKDEGAEAYITESNYDDTVRLAMQKEREEKWVLLQDTAWVGYERIPLWIMQGYTTIIEEIEQQLKEKQWEWPSHVLLQAGVGSMAAALLGALVIRKPTNAPQVAIVEPQNAACFFLSAQKNDGLPHPVEGDLQTIMAGLACGEPSTIAWKLIRDYADAFFSVPDHVAAKGMRIYGNPLVGDPRVISGESGAATLGMLSFLLSSQFYDEIASSLNLHQDSSVLVINTEGATDPVKYRRITWNGWYPSPY